ncbi:LysR family transcriptional regulator [Limnobacter sp.]|uniref:LysR family transcriptional regulator n=1 Tax=Limnobacter sp. TaxID=2003368 RepID=UPI00351922D3
MKLTPAILPSLGYFVHIAQHRSFTKAAAEMEVTRAALSQQLKSLETQLNVRLLNRTTRDISLTDEGQHLFDVLLPAFRAMQRGLEATQEAQVEPSGLIRINTSRVAARLLIEPNLSEFLALYPKLKIELMMNEGFSNIVAEGADVGIRMGKSLDEHMVAVPVTPNLEMAIVGSPDYFEKHGVPQSPEDLMQHNCLAYRFTTSGAIDKWSFSKPKHADESVVFEPNGNATFNDDESMIQAALQGVGLIQHIDLCVRKHLAEGRLVRVLKDWCKPFSGFYIYVPSRAQMPAKTRALIDFLLEKRQGLETQNIAR